MPRGEGHVGGFYDDPPDGMVFIQLMLVGNERWRSPGSHSLPLANTKERRPYPPER